MRRSLLFLPGNSPSMLFNGVVLPADSIILDLEDAVSIDQKDAARELVSSALLHLDYKKKEIIIRINPLSSPFGLADLRAVIPQSPQIIMPPKLEYPEQIHELCQIIKQLESDNHIPEGSIKLMPLLETALGIENAFQIAISSKRIIGFLLGGEDLSADLQCERTKKGTEIFYARTRVVNAARAAGIEVFDTPFTDVNDPLGIEEDTAFAKSLGFSGKACISPHHLKTVNRIFSPTSEEISYAKAVVAAYEKGVREGKGAVSYKGKMIDKPILLRAERTLKAAKAMSND